jgi:hypothetical protein
MQNVSQRCSAHPAPSFYNCFRSRVSTSLKLPTSGLHHPVHVYEKSGTMTSASQKATLPLPVASHQTVEHAKFFSSFSIDLIKLNAPHHNIPPRFHSYPLQHFPAHQPFSNLICSSERKRKENDYAGDGETDRRIYFRILPLDACEYWDWGRRSGHDVLVWMIEWSLRRQAFCFF